MSYLVLARKYRPQTFEEIVGQEHVTQTLQNAIRQGRLHHAFLFTGARGVGKTTAARILAKALSCDNAPTPTPCNQCTACVEITRGSSVDVQEIDAASNNGVDNIRELREAIRYAPVRGKKKVYILDEVHMLSSGAWNALLKTLEEPPPHAIFIFATTDPHKLPATILSRVQRYDFKLVPSRRIVEHLAHVLDAEGVKYERAALQLAARESGGSVRDSLSLLDQVVASIGADAMLSETVASEMLGVADRALLVQIGRAVVDKNADVALRLVEAAFVRGFDMAQLAQSLLGHLRDLVVVASVRDPGSLVEASDGELEELRGIVERAAPGLPEMLFERFAKVAEETTKSPTPRYVVEVGLIALTRTEPLEPIGPLLHKLEALETRLEKSGGAPRSAPSSKATRARAAESLPADATPIVATRTAPPTEAPASQPAPLVAAPAATFTSPTPILAPQSLAASQSGSSVAVSQATSFESQSSSLEPGASHQPATFEAGSSSGAVRALAATSESAAAPKPKGARRPSENAAGKATAPERRGVVIPLKADVPPLPDAGEAPPFELLGFSEDECAVPPTTSEIPADLSSQAVASPADQTPAPRPAARVFVPGDDFVDLVEAILAIDPLLAALALARLVRWDENELVLGFDKDFDADALRPRLPHLGKALLKVVGTVLNVEIIVGSEAAALALPVPAPTVRSRPRPPISETLVEVEDRRTAEDREQRRLEALHHPMRKAISDTFGGVWRDPVVDNLDREN